MTEKQGPKTATNEISEAVKDLLIVQLGIAGVPQRAIRQIVGCSMNRVNRIAKHLKPITQKTEPKRG